jgi:hemerythrin
MAFIGVIMAIYEWSDKFETGIPVVDEQHKALFRMLNDLHESLASGKGKEEIVRAMDFLLSCTTSHHETEEKFMQEHGFPELSAHRSEHLAVQQNAAFFRECWMKTPDSVHPMELVRLIGEWVIHHIEHSDFRYVEFLKVKGIPPTPI